MFGRFGATLTRDFKPRFEPLAKLGVLYYYGRGNFHDMIIYLLLSEIPIATLTWGFRLRQCVPRSHAHISTKARASTIPSSAVAGSPVHGVLYMKIRRTRFFVLKNH